MSNSFFHTVAAESRDSMNTAARFTEADADVLAKYQNELLALAQPICQAFYDGLFANPKTRAVFKDGERPAREQTLIDWWDRTIRGPINEDYWAWQAYVGLLHVKRRVTNTMMLAQTSVMLEVVRNHHPDKVELHNSLSRLLTNVGAVIAHAYDQFFSKSLEAVTGMSMELIQNQVAIGVDDVLAQYKR